MINPIVEPISMEEYNRHELMLMKSRNKNGVNFDTEWDLFGKEFLGNIRKVISDDGRK